MAEWSMQHVALRDDRQARVCVHGPDNGTPLIYLHGIPGSCLELMPDHELLTAHGVRLFCVERPGYGESDGSPVSDFHGWAAWLEEVAEAFGLRQSALMGLSTGGVYAMAMAVLRPHRVTRLVLCETPAPMVGWDALDGMEDSVRPLWELASTSRERLSRNILSAFSADPERLVEATRATLPPEDIAIIDSADGLGRHSASIREAVRQGYDALAEELGLVAGNWGFEPDGVVHPVTIFHGDLDQNIPPSHARQLSDLLPRSTLRALPGYGHYALFHRPVFESMLESAMAASRT